MNIRGLATFLPATLILEMSWNWQGLLGSSQYKASNRVIISSSIDFVSKRSLKIEKSDLFPHWIIMGIMALSLLVYLMVCYQFGHELQEPIPEEDRLVIRTIFYAIAIIIFPMTNLIRHIQLRLNQTMPGNNPAKNRYFLTVIVSMLLVEGVGVLGFVMYMLGDDFNTLYLFLGLSALGLFLYRPKEDEYIQIVDALATEADTTPITKV